MYEQEARVIVRGREPEKQEKTCRGKQVSAGLFKNHFKS